MLEKVSEEGANKRHFFLRLFRRNRIRWSIISDWLAILDWPLLGPQTKRNPTGLVSPLEIVEILLSIPALSIYWGEQKL
jgi:hypothetical protein